MQEQERFEIALAEYEAKLERGRIFLKQDGKRRDYAEHKDAYKARAKRQATLHPEKRREYVRRSEARPDAKARKSRSRRARRVAFPASQRLVSLQARCLKKGWALPDFDAQWLEDQLDALGWRCVVCSKPMTRVGTHRNDPMVWSVDRVDSTAPYIKTNVALMHVRCNKVKNDGTAEEHENIARFMRARGVA